MKVKAIVTVSVTVALPDNWGVECQLNQVFDQAANKARNIVTQHMATVPNSTIHKEVQVKTVITEERLPISEPPA